MRSAEPHAESSPKSCVNCLISKRPCEPSRGEPHPLLRAGYLLEIPLPPLIAPLPPAASTACSWRPTCRSPRCGRPRRALLASPYSRTRRSLRPTYPLCVESLEAVRRPGAAACRLREGHERHRVLKPGVQVRQRLGRLLGSVRGDLVAAGSGLLKRGAVKHLHEL